ncbi:hypothetical protein [Legionella brunensis]|uniref:Uncharacterized protein n=1 Tax=Legionella brunensis TaxID=29422 RepID=A0A0W0STA7_9GAMM|nr:hypothetical protein [Legionella brunensis]KTC86513.1 hypothetical protein Lbru_0454 [Legionella brunensis]
MKEVAISLNKQGKTFLKRRKEKSIKKALQKFNEAISIEPVYDEAWYNKGLAHLKLKEYPEGFMAFTVVAALNPQHLQARKQLEVIKQLKQAGEYKSDENMDKFFRPFICSQEYLKEFEQLGLDHKKISTRSFPEQIAWINQLLQFIFKYYESHNKPFVFALNQSILQPTHADKQFRLAIINHLLGTKLSYEDNSVTRILDLISSTQISTVLDDIFMDDAKIAIRMVFETIHQFSREERAKLLEFLPWGTNSWYLLEFCGSLFIPDDNITKVNESGGLPLSFHYEGDEDKNILGISEYYKALREDICIVKTAMLDIIKNDLRVLQTFFISLENRFAGREACQILPIEDLPNFRPLLWYSKHSIHFLRLLALLPNDLSIPTILAEPVGDMESITPIVQLQQLLHSSSFSNSLKGRLAFLRTMELVGEVFTTRSWGNHLKSVDYISPDMLTNLRNGFSHVEDLRSFAVIEMLEREQDVIDSLQAEFVIFKQELYGVIAQRQSHFPKWPTISSGFSTWEKPVSEYWQAVKKYYEIPLSFNDTPYAPNQALLNEDDIKTVLTAIKPIRPGFMGDVVKMLRGQVPFITIKSDGLLDTLSPRDKRPIMKLLSKAESVYKDAKKVAKNAAVLESATRRRKQEATIRSIMATKYPTIEKFGLKLFEELKIGAGETKDDKVSVSSLVDRLKNRMGVLEQLLVESELLKRTPLLKKEILETVLSKDIELLLSTSYLIAQIISIANELASREVLNLIDPVLNKRLPMMIGLRNALEHSDPIQDSAELALHHMKSKIPQALASIMVDLINDHMPVLMTVDGGAIVAPVLNNGGVRIKQGKAMDATAFAMPGNNPAGFFSVSTADSEQPITSLTAEYS